MDICVIGAGYVGTVNGLSCCLWGRNHVYFKHGGVFGLFERS